jgi:hypothetical protein
MARKRMTVGSKYVAIGALTDLMVGVVADADNASRTAEWLVSQAWDVEHLPTAGRVTITFDLQRLERPVEPDDES